MTAPPWFSYGLAHPGEAGAVTVDGATITYERWAGPEEAPGVVLIHGSNAHRHWWRFLAPYLARKYTVAALDLSGHGDSDHRDRYSGETFAREVFAVCDAALPPKPFVIGHSFGGFVALQAAHYFGAQLRGVIFNDFTVRPRSSYVEWGLRAQREGRTEPRTLRTYPDLDTALGRFRLVPEQPPLDAEIHRFLAEAGLKAVDGGWTWKFDPALFDHLEMGMDQVDRFAHLACPSAVILGEHSADDGARSGPFLSAATEGLLPIITLPDMHHHMMFENPLALLAAFEGFLDSWRAEAERDRLKDLLAALPTFHEPEED